VQWNNPNQEQDARRSLSEPWAGLDSPETSAMSDMRRMPSSVRVLVVAICHIRQLGDGARVSVERSEPLPKGEGPAPMLTRYHGARHRQKWRQGLCAFLCWFLLAGDSTHLIGQHAHYVCHHLASRLCTCAIDNPTRSTSSDRKPGCHDTTACTASDSCAHGAATDRQQARAETSDGGEIRAGKSKVETPRRPSRTCPPCPWPPRPPPVVTAHAAYGCG
jgi:hypothetical protein